MHGARQRQQTSLFFGRRATKALWYLGKEAAREPEEPLFLGVRGTHAGEPLTRSELFAINQSLGQIGPVASVALLTPYLSPYVCRRVSARWWQPVRPQGDFGAHYIAHGQSLCGVGTG